MDRKPAGIVILAILSFISSIFFLSNVFFAQFGYSVMRGLIGNRSYFNSFGTGAVVINLIFFSYHLTIGVGLLQVRNWARILYLINTWIATIVLGLSSLIFIVLAFVTGPVALLFFLLSAIFMTVNIFILRYLYKPEIINLFTLSINTKSDSYSLPSQFGEVDTQSEEFNDDDFPDSTLSHINVGTTIRKSKEEPKTQLMESRPSIIALLIKDMGNGKYKHFDIEKDRTSIGRSSQNDIIIKDDITIGRQHAQILFKHGKFWIYDLASTNGTFVNGKKIEKHDLIEGDEIKIGKTKFIFKSLNV